MTEAAAAIGIILIFAIAAYAMLNDEDDLP
jgi:hypothetical protein